MSFRKEEDPKDIQEEGPNTMLIARCYIHDKEGRILLLRRNPNRKYNPDKWELPGGKVERWQDFHQAVHDEILGETGFNVAITDPFAPFLISKQIIEGPYAGKFYLEHVFDAALKSGKFRLSPDHQDFIWHHPEEALDLDLSPEARKAITHHMGLILD